MSKARVLFSTGSLYPMDTEYCFEVAAEAQADGLEIMVDSRWSTRDLNYLRQLSDQYNQPILSIHSPMLHIVQHLLGWNLPHPLRDVDTVKKSVQMAEALNAEVVVMHLPVTLGVVQAKFPSKFMLFPWFRNPDGNKSADFIEHELANYQKTTNVKVCVENLPVRRLLGRKINPIKWNNIEEWSTCAPYLTIDTTHWATFGIDPYDAYQAAKDRIAHVHLSNFANGKEHRLPHQGEVDLGKFLRAMAEDGFDGTITIELHPDSLGFPDRDAMCRNLKDSVDFCREHLA